LSLSDDARLAVSFLTRLPVTLRTTPTSGALARSMTFFPLVGGLVGALCGAVYYGGRLILPACPAALLALAAGVLLTGGLHEDGLADCADGFGGGSDKDRKLAIMRDSRIGSYGALALVFSISLRAGALAELDNWRSVLPALIVAHSFGRALLPLIMVAMPSASDKGLAAEAGRPTAISVIGAVMLALIIAGLSVKLGIMLLVLSSALLAAWLFGRLAKSQIGGYSGDVLGAAEQIGEIAVLLSILASRQLVP
jgi:adenosylcobinamide-GDP ribazoletransferase